MKHWNNCSKKEKLERWENALRVLRDMPRHERRKHWDMSLFGEKTDCGTVACAAGHCGLDPWFRRRGFQLNFEKVVYDDGSADYRIANRTDKKGPVDDIRFEEDVDDFFGSGAEYIFFNGLPRPVGKVILEIRHHIKALQENL